MRLPRPQFTVRRMMIIVALCAVVAWLLLAAIQIEREPNSQTLCHLRRFTDNGERIAFGHGSTAWTFWSKYWRRVLGLPWPGSFVCPCKAEFEKKSQRSTVDLATSNDMRGRKPGRSSFPIRMSFRAVVVPVHVSN
jgi:hypothetical protein